MITSAKTYCGWSPKIYRNHLAVHWVLEHVDDLRCKGITGVKFAVLIVLAAHCGKTEPTCWLDYDTIALESTWSRRACVEAIAKLMAAEVIKIIGKHRSGANWYRLNITTGSAGDALLDSAPGALGVQEMHSSQSAPGSIPSALGSKQSAPGSIPSAPPAYEVVPGSSTDEVDLK